MFLFFLSFFFILPSSFVTHSSFSDVIVDYGRVCCVDVCNFGNQCWVVCGYQSGNVVLWDFNNKRMIKNVSYHSHPIINVKFIHPAATSFIAADTNVSLIPLRTALH